jgi:hypothetical protein
VVPAFTEVTRTTQTSLLITKVATALTTLTIITLASGFERTDLDDELQGPFNFFFNIFEPAWSDGYC